MFASRPRKFAASLRGIATALAPRSSHSAAAPVSYSAPAPSGPSIHADTVNINYGNNSQVGTTSSNNGSTVGNEYGHGHSAGHHGYTSSYGAVSAPVNSGPIDFGDGIGDGTWGNGGSVNTGSYSVGTTSVLGGYQGGYQSSAPYSAPIAPTVSPSSGAGGSYFVGSGQTFQAPSAGQIAAECANSTFGCAGSYSSTAPSYSSTPSYGHTTGHSASGGYSFCDSDKVYNDDGALLVGGGPVCR